LRPFSRPVFGTAAPQRKKSGDLLSTFPRSQRFNFDGD